MIKKGCQLVMNNNTSTAADVINNNNNIQQDLRPIDSQSDNRTSEVFSLPIDTSLSTMKAQPLTKRIDGFSLSISSKEEAEKVLKSLRRYKRKHCYKFGPILLKKELPEAKTFIQTLCTSNKSVEEIINAITFTSKRVKRITRAVGNLLISSYLLWEKFGWRNEPSVNATIFPNQGFDENLDECRLPSVIKLLVDVGVITKYNKIIPHCVATHKPTTIPALKKFFDKWQPKAKDRQWFIDSDIFGKLITISRNKHRRSFAEEKIIKRTDEFVDKKFGKGTSALTRKPVGNSLSVRRYNGELDDEKVKTAVDQSGYHALCNVPKSERDQILETVTVPGLTKVVKVDAEASMQCNAGIFTNSSTVIDTFIDFRGKRGSKNRAERKLAQMVLQFGGSIKTARKAADYKVTYKKIREHSRFNRRINSTLIEDVLGFKKGELTYRERCMAIHHVHTVLEGLRIDATAALNKRKGVKTLGLIHDEIIFEVGVDQDCVDERFLSVDFAKRVANDDKSAIDEMINALKGV